MFSREEKTILLVDDQVLIAMAEKIDLEGFGYKVLLAHYGEQAVEAVRKNNIDLILMDINLGRGMDGTEAAAIILKEHDVPVVFLSSHTEHDVVEKTEKITSYGYVVKNSGATVLDASIKMAFKLFEANRKIKDELTVRGRIETALRTSEQSQRELLKNLDQKLRQSEYAQLWNVYAQSRVPSFTIDESGRIIDYNQAEALLTGYAHADVPDMVSLITRVCPDEDYRREILGRYRNYMDNNINVTQEEFHIINKSGEKRYIIMSAYDIMHENRITGLKVIQTEDITEQKAAEQALTESEQKYRTLFKSMSQGFYVSEILYDEAGIPRDYRFLDVNAAFERIAGLSRERIIGSTYNELVPPDPDSGWLDCFKRVAATGVPENYTFVSNVYGTYFETYAFRPEEGIFAALVKDVTERR